MKEQFVVGIVRGAHGLSGEFKVASTSGEYGHFARMEEVALSDGTDSRRFAVEYTHEAAGTLYMKLAGINAPEEAARFNRWQIVVPRKYARPLQPGEWYVEDLKGCSVWYGHAAHDGEAAAQAAPAGSAAGDTVGTVTDVREGGSGYLVEILLSEGCRLLADDVKFTRRGEPRTVLVPFRDEFIGEVDVQGRRMQLMHLWILE